MPRVVQFKHHPRFHPNSSATRRPFRYRVQKKTNLQRVLVALHTTRPTAPTRVQEILDTISDQAAETDEVLGPRWKQFVYIALSILRKNGCLQVNYDDDDEYCRLTQDGVQIMTDADDNSDLWHQPSTCEKYKRAGQYLQWLLSPTRMRPLTRRELDIENRQLEQQLQEHMEVCPMSTNVQNEIPQDPMDVDGVPVAGPSTIHTPIRNSAALHNPAAYPTPQSIPRASSIPRPASISPPPTPLSRNFSSSVHLNSDGGDQSEANSVRNRRPASPPQTPSLFGIQQGDHNSDAPMSDEGDLEPVSTCYNMDWDNIRHVTAISKALQEKNDMLQQKMEYLEKEKEDCTHQLDQANSKVENIKAELRDMRSRSWLLRWRYTTRMTVLQTALDSAIDERENHKQQNMRLQARLNDIDRRRAAIRRIEDAENAPDDQLLSVIADSLQP